MHPLICCDRFADAPGAGRTTMKHATPDVVRRLYSVVDRKNGEYSPRETQLWSQKGRSTHRGHTLTAGSTPRNVWKDSPGETDLRLVLATKLLSKNIDTFALASSK